MVLHLPHLAFFPWESRSRGSSLFTPPGQCSSECWSNLSVAGGHQGQLWARLSEAWTIRCALRTRYVQLLSGFVGTSGRLCWSCFNIVKMYCNRDSEADRVFPGEGISFVTVRAYNGLSWDTPAGYYLSKAVPAVMWQMGIC